MTFMDDNRTPDEYRQDARRSARAKWVYRLIFAPVVVLCLAVLVSLLWPWSEIRFTQFVPASSTYPQGSVARFDDTFCWGPGASGAGQAFTNLREFVTVQPDGSLGPTRYGVGDVSFDFYTDESRARYSPENDFCAPSSVRVQVPLVLPPGRWVVRYTVVYDPTPLPFDTISLDNTSEPFLVTVQDQIDLGGDPPRVTPAPSPPAG